MQSAKQLLTLSLSISSVFAFGQAGSLDPSFGTDGISAVLHVSLNGNDVKSMGLQSDGKIVLVGDVEPGSSIWDRAYLGRLNPDGSIDNTFPEQALDFGEWDHKVGDLEILANGKILIAGQGHFDPDDGLIVERRNTDGSLDNSFGNSGQVFYPGLDGRELIIQSDGKFLVIGSFDDEVTRFNSDGSIDNSFATGGTFQNGQFGSAVSGGFIDIAALQSDGKLLIGLSGYNGAPNMGVGRLNADGSVDTGFGVNGVAHMSASQSDHSMNSIVQLSNGKIMVGGSSYDGSDFAFTMFRLNANGTLDNSFGNSGVFREMFGDFISRCYSIHREPDNRLLCVATREWEDNLSFIPFNSDGSFDDSFGPSGIFVDQTDIETRIPDLGDVILQPDGKLLFSSHTSYGLLSSSDRAFGVFRYFTNLNTGILDFSIPENQIELYPNPVTQAARVDFELLNDEVLDMTLLNTDGKEIKVFSQDKRWPAGKNSVLLDFDESVAAGAYIVMIKNNTGSHSIRVIVN